ncbi:MAG: hypothetical protein MJZ28_12470 [Paludibacteraceae bacterium]|nr:hypothetical protein [Paludibacteraceae bacterium]
MAKIINDPVFGELEYNEKEGYWTKKIFLGILWEDDEQLDLMVKCAKDEEITDAQRNAYKNYISTLEKTEEEIPQLILSYYKDHYEDIERRWNLDEDLKIDVVDEDILLDGFDTKSLFIDRNGNYGWLVNLVWKNNPISVILSDDKIRIYEEWAVLVSNYERVDDEVFGDMVYDFGWNKSIKMDINGEKGVWIDVTAAAYPGEKITQEQRDCYLEYQNKEKEYFDKLPDALMSYYLENYEQIDEWWDGVPKEYNKRNITKKSLMELIEIHKIYFNRDGKRYGWLCGCEWDDVHGLGITLSEDEIHIGWDESLFD